MRHKKFLLALPLLSLASCSIDFSIVSIIGSSSSDYSYHVSSQQEYSQSGQAEKRSVLEGVSMRDLGRSTLSDALPSTGNTRVLVLPIELSDYPFGSFISRDLDHAFNGSTEDTRYWESVSSFYYKSSYGKINLTFDVAEVYACPYTAKEAYQRFSSDNAISLINLALQAYKTNHGRASTKQYDSDSDGWIDGVIAVYSCPDYTQDLSIERYDKDGFYWAYTYWAAGQQVVESPTMNLYFWVSYDFLYEAVATPAVDAHTLIHETGHMLGLDDYYPDDTSDFDPVGGLDMMSHNILDHDCYSKMVLGWTDPYVVTGPAEITLNPSSVNGDCILIPTSSWNGTAFDEYMLVELYTPDGLNYLDSHVRYPNRMLGFTQPGVKIFHVDSRIMRFKYRQGQYLNVGYAPDPRQMTVLDEWYYVIGATNCNKSGYFADSRFSLIHMMESSGRNTFVNGTIASDSSLFHQGDSFSLTRFGQNFFPNKTTFNNGDTFPYTITVSHLSATSATISITL